MPERIVGHAPSSLSLVRTESLARNDFGERCQLPRVDLPIAQYENLELGERLLRFFQARHVLNLRLGLAVLRNHERLSLCSKPPPYLPSVGLKVADGFDLGRILQP